MGSKASGALSPGHWPEQTSDTRARFEVQAVALRWAARGKYPERCGGGHVEGIRCAWVQTNGRPMLAAWAKRA